MQSSVHRFGRFHIHPRAAEEIERPLAAAAFEKTEIGIQLGLYRR